ncbi:MAG TPA: hypothetical protein VFT04_12885 [Gemmatimonadales bacterium]|nr:hypothetical protein [Gemmatimonadales bacterium]
MSVFDGFRARLDRILAESGGRADGRAYVSGLRDAVIEAKAAVASMRDQLGVTERELATEQRQLADAERRGTLAEGIGDTETASVATRFAGRHRERAGVLERKLAVQREELVLASRELDEMMAELRKTQPAAGGRAASSSASAEAAWRDIQAAGGARPDTDLDGELLKAEAERKLHEAAVDAQLAHLKKKLGRE